MQQILDRTQESLAQAFASLARNARRQQHLYYATIGLLIAIVVVSAALLAVLAAAREIDYRRGMSPNMSVRSRCNCRARRPSCGVPP